MATAFPIYGGSSGAFSIITGFFYNQSAPTGHPQILATLPGKDYVVVMPAQINCVFRTARQQQNQQHTM
jgi:hypothetical protein